MRKRFAVPLAAIALATASCGRSNGLYPVSGRVTYNGQPAFGAAVILQRRGAVPLEEHLHMAVVQRDGSFTVDSGSLGKGAPPGEYVVLVRWKYDPDLPAARSPAEASSRPDRLKGRYSDARHPLLQAVVRPEANILPPIELTE